MLQFISNGHFLGFRPDGVIATTGNHTYRVTFVAEGTTPIADPVSIDYDVDSASSLGRVTYPNLWPGITLAYDAPAGTILRSTYYLAPYADSSQVQLHYNVPLYLEHDGRLTLAFESGRLSESAPIAWQEINGQRQPVDVSFRLIAGDSSKNQSGGDVHYQIGFKLGDYDPAYALVIDPSLTWTTFLGDENYNSGSSIALDSSGNVFVVGRSDASWGSPIRAYTSVPDAFVAKLDSSGELLWNTFLGGTESDEGYGIAVDSNGNVYITGNSYASWGTPIQGFTSDRHAFVAKLDSNGTLVWNTFLGSWGNGIALDSSGNIYVTGNSTATWGTPIRAYTGGDADALVAKLDSNGNLIWHTFLGGSDSDGGLDIALDGSDNIYLSGFSNASWGDPVRTYSSGGDAFIAKLNSSGHLIWNTFLGGNDFEFATGLALDSNANIYVTGYGYGSWGVPVRAYTSDLDAFAAKLDNSGNLIWNTFLGNSDADTGTDIVVDSNNNIYLTGSSTSVWGTPIQPTDEFFRDALFAKLETNGNLSWHLFLGSNWSEAGIGSDWLEEGFSIAVNGMGDAYVTGSSVDINSEYHGLIFITKINPAVEIEVQGNGQAILNGSTTPTATNHTDFGNLALGEAITHTFTISNSNAISVTLSGSPPVTLTTANPFSVTIQPGSPVISNSSTIFAITFDPKTTGSFTDTVNIGGSYYTFVIRGQADVPINGLSAANDSPTILGDSTALTATISAGSSVSFTWNFGDDSTGNGAVVNHIYGSIGSYTATVTATNSINSDVATTVVTIIDEAISGLNVTTSSPTTLGFSTTLTATISSGSNVNYTWRLGDGNSASGTVIKYNYGLVGSYTATVTATNGVSEVTTDTLVTIMSVNDDKLYLPAIIKATP